MNSKKIVAIIVSTLMLSTPVFALPKPVSTYNPYAKPNGPAGKSHMNHLYLIEKNPSDWSIVSDGAWGKLTFNSNKFTFNGHNLVSGTSYTLINYIDPWGSVNYCLASGTANDNGNIHLSGMYNLVGARKVWLILSSDINCNTGYMTGWNPTSYLFEYDLV